jgi:cytochrome c
MNRFLPVLCALMVTAHAADTMAQSTSTARATKEEATAFVKKAVEYFKANGSEKAFAAFNDHNGKFIDKDLYIFCYDPNGVTLAHGKNPLLIGKSRLDEQDADGTYINRERMELMKTQHNFWMHYKFSDPVTHKIAPKSTYCEVVDDPALKHVLICSGVYDVQ